MLSARLSAVAFRKNIKEVLTTPAFAKIRPISTPELPAGIFTSISGPLVPPGKSKSG